MATLRHVAIILDGNRRWAAARGMPALLGHTEGAKNLERIAKAALERGVGFLTVFALSTENVKHRSPEELLHLFSLIGKLVEQEKKFHENGVRFRAIGDLEALPTDVRERLKLLEERTSTNLRMTLAVAVNYGSRDEIVRAARATRGAADEAALAGALDTASLPDVDLVIRTGGHRRLSNFLLWQSAYAELYFTDTLWPAFSEDELAQALEWFARQQRNNGK